MKLETMQEIADEVKRLYRDARAGKIKHTEASKLCFLLQTRFAMLKDLRVHDRLDKLEDDMNVLTGTDDAVAED